jgi:uncharacterized repeat protein (TIGR04138 family)
VTDDPIGDVIRRDPRYPRAAYEFVREALHKTIESIGEQRHVSARELLVGLRDHARSEFGPLARTVFESWGVHETADFGRIVYNLVEAGEMGKTDEDRLEDFEAVYDLDKAFPKETGEVELRRKDDDEDE